MLAFNATGASPPSTTPKDNKTLKKSGSLFSVSKILPMPFTIVVKAGSIMPKTCLEKAVILFVTIFHALLKDSNCVDACRAASPVCPVTTSTALSSLSTLSMSRKIISFPVFPKIVTTSLFVAPASVSFLTIDIISFVAGSNAFTSPVSLFITALASFVGFCIEFIALAKSLPAFSPRTPVSNKTSRTPIRFSISQF